MPIFYLPDQRAPRSAPTDVSEIAGADVEFRGGMRVVAGDWSTVSGEAAAQQSVIREAAAPQGSLTRLPEWGGGGQDSVLRGLSSANVGKLVTRQRARLQANPRVQSVQSVTTQRLSGNQGVALILEYVPVGSQSATRTIVKARR